ncbi:hypothetical protein CgunFtcFv8_024545 [Champsocephalus gunnari]|uniref:Uncharacterized protein n=1 Tax=Champsocephalus gunnari TaxID=52237 RepID=A0AAN8DIU1_CHAGU|nr:hypothetical protein CgunFtcFv8_024545 [Champsocephalus gunnari]
MLFTVPPVLQTKASLLSAECSCHRRFFTLLPIFTGDTDTILFPLSLQFLPSLSALPAPAVRVNAMLARVPRKQMASESRSRRKTMWRRDPVENTKHCGRCSNKGCSKL